MSRISFPVESVSLSGGSRSHQMALSGKKEIYLGLHLEEGRKSHALREISLSSCFQRSLSVSSAISFTLFFFPFYQDSCWNCIIQRKREECDIYWWLAWMEEKELTVTDSEDSRWQKRSKLWIKTYWNLRRKPLYESAAVTWIILL